MKSILRVLFCTLLIATIFSCKKAGNGKVNIVNALLTAKIDTLDPAVSYDAVSGTVVYQVYESLFEYHYLKRPYTLQENLAASQPTVENNGLRYIFTIKKGIPYHDHPVFNGKPRYVKAEDFLTAIKRQAFVPTRGQGYFLFEGRVKGIGKFRKDAGSDFGKFESLPIEGFNVIDDQTFSLDLTKPYPQLLYAFAMAFTAPIPLEVIKYHKNDISSVMVGTGPFYLEKWDRNLQVMLKRYPKYRNVLYPSNGDRHANASGMLSDANKKIPFLMGIKFNIIKEPNPRWLKFRKKEIDYLRIPKDNFATAITGTGTLSPELKKEGIQLQIAPTLTTWWMAFNMEDQVVGTNKNLRMAIAHAIDTDKFINLFTNNVGLSANSIYAPGVPGYSPTITQPFKFDLDIAKDYLKKAGFEDGKGLPTITYDTRTNNAVERQMSEFFKTQLLHIGVDLKVSINNYPGFLEKMRNGNLQFWRGGWTLDYPDGENLLQLLITQNKAPKGINDAMYSNPKFDALFEKLKVLPNGTEKYQIMKEMEETMQEDLPWAMLYYRRGYNLNHGYLKNYRPSDLINNYFKYLRLEPR